MISIANYPKLTEDEYGFTTRVTVPAFSGFTTRLARLYPDNQPKDGTVMFHCEKHIASEVFLNETQWIIEHADEVIDMALQALVPQYQIMREYLLEELSEEEDLNTAAPIISSHLELKRLSRPDYFNVYAPSKSHEFSVIFSCDWEEEHGAGVMFNDLHVTDVGGADI